MAYTRDSLSVRVSKAQIVHLCHSFSSIRYPAFCNERRHGLLLSITSSKALGVEIRSLTERYGENDASTP
jgi:hypothetical protein